MVVARLVAGRRQDLFAMHNLHFQQDISVVPSCTYKPQAVKSKSATRSANELSWAVEVTAKDMALFSKRSPENRARAGEGDDNCEGRATFGGDPFLPLTSCSRENSVIRMGYIDQGT